MKDKYLLFGDYSIELSNNEEEFFKYFKENRDKVFVDYCVFRFDEIMTETEKENLNNLNKNKPDFYKLRFYILKGDTKIGWFLGEQINRDTFYMRNSALFEEYRNKGIYKKLLALLIGILKEKGFQKITSSHVATNNHIIVAKLKAGFMITGFEISDAFGLLINLTYNFNEIRNKVLKFRTGEISPDEQLTQILKLNKNK